MPFLTKIAKATPKSASLRTTIPKQVAEQLDIKLHDILIWDIIDNQIIIKKWDKNE